MRSAAGAFLILVCSVAMAGGSHGGGGAHSGASRAAATSASRIQSASQPRSAARTAMRPLPPRPKPRPGRVPTTPPATRLWLTTAAVYPAGWYAVACTEEERRQHRCPDEASATRPRE
jgi:hypothetical protein